MQNGADETHPGEKSGNAAIVIDGRPRLEFDLQAVKKFGQCVSSYSEMAAFFKCTKKTIQNRMDEQGAFFSAYMEGKAETCTKLRYRQIQMAMAGDTRMSTWLGMQFLDQKNVARESVEHKVSGQIDVTKHVVFTIKPQGHGIEEAGAGANGNGKNGHARPGVNEASKEAAPSSN